MSNIVTDEAKSSGKYVLNHSHILNEDSVGSHKDDHKKFKSETEKKYGNIKVYEINARNLVAKDKGVSSDPYITFHMLTPGKKHPKLWKSSAIKKTLNPSWAFDKDPLAITDYHVWSPLHIEIKDKDLLVKVKSAFMGSIEINPGTLAYLQKISGKDKITLEFHKLGHKSLKGHDHSNITGSINITLGITLK
eukprot:TRINITY_DN507_c0_g1_i1.p1 TRINITY_DN507_c0_g1~~TRINITY_DN507_c0_g1_i1.p1  ORF type:complete len:192 (-),score=36.71 TRINITY_DN507_c0_g1_i1:103-678(-)